MKQRIVATAVLLVLLLGLPALLGKWGGFLLILVFGLGTLLELLGLLQRAGRPADRLVATVALAALLLGLMLAPQPGFTPFAVVAGAVTLILIACLLRLDSGYFTTTALPTVGVVLFVGLPFGAATLLLRESGPLLPLWVVLLTKSGDVGALLTGMAVGSHRMVPRLSPHKTWEGLAGGLLAGVLFVVVARNGLPAGLTAGHAAWMALLIGGAGVLGDLMESAFKREAKAKDSGTLIPGIGGLFDLCDSLLPAFTVAYFLTWLVL